MSTGEPAANESPVPPVRVHKFDSIGAGRPEDMNRLQKSFYARHFKPRFLTDDPIDVDGQDGYGVVMLHELLEQFDTDPDVTVAGLELLQRAYPKSSAAREAQDSLRDINLLNGEWADALGRASNSWALPIMLGLAEELGHPRLSPVTFFMWNPGSLTKIAIRELDGVMDKLAEDLDRFHDEHGISIVEDLWNRLAADVPVAELVGSIRNEVGADLDDEDIAWSIEKAREFGLYYWPRAFAGYEKHERPITLPRPWPRPESFGRIWKAFVKTHVRAAENYARMSAGLPRVGEGLVAEIRLLNELRAAFPHEVVHHQVRPTWLAPQSLDMVFANRKVAVEYQGAQHSRPIHHFGGQAAFEMQQMRDANKRAICAANGMRLVEVHPDYVLADVVQEIRDLMGDVVDSLPDEHAPGRGTRSKRH